MRSAIVSYLLEYFYSFSAAELNNIENEDEVFAQEFAYKKSDYGDSDDEDIFNNCISGTLNNNYFPSNESSSLY